LGRTYRYSGDAARRATIRLVKQAMAPMLLGLFLMLGAQWYFAVGKPVWRRLLHGGNAVFIFAGVTGITFGMMRSLFGSLTYTLRPDAFDGVSSLATVSIPRDQVSEILVGPNELTVCGRDRTQRIRVAAELEGYPELLESLRLWAPETVRWGAGRRVLWQWAVFCVLLAIGVGFVILIRSSPKLALRLMAAVILTGPFWFWRARYLPIELRWAAGAGAAVTAGSIFALTYLLK